VASASPGSGSWPPADAPGAVGFSLMAAATVRLVATEAGARVPSPIAVPTLTPRVANRRAVPPMLI